MKLGFLISLIITFVPSLTFGYSNGLTVLGATGVFAFGFVIYRRKVS